MQLLWSPRGLQVTSEQQNSEASESTLHSYSHPTRPTATNEVAGTEGVQVEPCRADLRQPQACRVHHQCEALHVSAASATLPIQLSLRVALLREARALKAGDLGTKAFVGRPRLIGFRRFTASQQPQVIRDEISIREHPADGVSCNKTNGKSI